jgi:hypothetical protein
VAGAFRSGSSVAPGTRTNTTITAPSGIQNNDILLIVISVGAASGITPTPPAGFTILPNFPAEYSQPDPYTVRVYAYWKLASGETGNYTVMHSSASSEAYMAAYSGADAAPINPSPSVAVDADGGVVSDGIEAAGLTTANDGSVVIYIAATWNAVGPSSPPTGTTPTFSERYDGGAGGTLYVADGVLATAGATGVKSIPAVSNHPTWAAALIALEADTGGGGATATAQPGVGAVSLNGRAPGTSSFTNVRIREVLVNESGQPVGGATGIDLLVWYAGYPIGAPDVSLASLTTDADGTTSWSIPTGTLAYQQPIFYVATSGDTSPSAYTCARLTPNYE